MSLHIDTSKIESIPLEEQEAELRELGLQVFDQKVLERDVLAQVDEILAKQNQSQPVTGAVLNQQQLIQVETGQETINENLPNELCDYEARRNLESHLKELCSNEHGYENSKSFDAAAAADVTTRSGVAECSEIDTEIVFSDDSVHIDCESDGSNWSADHSTGSRSPEEESLNSEDEECTEHTKKQIYVGKPPRKAKRKRLSFMSDKSSKKARKTIVRSKDDGDDRAYEKRLRKVKEAELARGELTKSEDGSDGSDVEISGGYKVPRRMWNKLYRYQKTGVRWLWELHCQHAGGILADEMGLGKTIQIICFLAGLRHSNLSDIAPAMRRFEGLGPTLIVCPATLLHQWVSEVMTWWPSVRVAVLHSSGSYSSSEKNLVSRIVASRGLLVTSYSTLLNQCDVLLRADWHYIILDEGHKIRNPDAKVTLVCKQFKTRHRIILSGSPMQNCLKELWSLVDFIYPGKLGTLPDFMQQFSVPIVQGGYANASELQVKTAFKCACILRDTISPYLLQRMKSDVQVHIDLPGKTEQVLFCRLTEYQRQLYKEYLSSAECHMIMSGSLMAFPGLITLRKLCNHPDLTTGGFRDTGGDELIGEEGAEELGFYKRSGKMIVVDALLKLWKKQNHKVLLFSQSRQMLDILENFLKRCEYSYLRMDGNTTISTRQTIIQQFNEDSSVFLFLLTTKVGGLGTNLTGADRVIIFDPDWNPSTDTQARERAWRIGQTKPVTIFRLLTTGTIEEKILHRQVFKQFLTNRVLKNPKQRRFFKSNDLMELFTLGDDDPKAGTETSAIFSGTEANVYFKPSTKQKPSKVAQRPNRFDVLRESKNVASERAEGAAEGAGEECDSEDESVVRMKNLAKLISQKIAVMKTEKSLTNQKISKNEGTKSCELTKPVSAEDHSNIGNKHRKKNKSKRKKSHNIKIDGEVVVNVDRLETERKKTDRDEVDVKEENILNKLLRKSGVHSALQHDQILESSQADYVLLEAEADKVAAEASQALRASRLKCQQEFQLGRPTWTGQHGLVGAPGNRARFGQKSNAAKPNLSTIPASSNKPRPAVFDGSSLFESDDKIPDKSALSSSDILNRLKSREFTPVDGSSEDSSGVAAALATKPNCSAEEFDLISDIQQYLRLRARVCGQATTEEIVKEFKNKLSNAQVVNFRSMLKQICTFDNKTGKGVWCLKPEYR